jgi:hypothetical protein
MALKDLHIENASDNYIEEIKELLLNTGFIVIENPKIKDSLYYSDGKRIGHVSRDSLDFYHVSSVYKASRENGTGAVYAKGFTKRWSDFDNAMTHAFSGNVEWYNDLTEFLQTPVYGFGGELDKIKITMPDRTVMTGEEYVFMQKMVKKVKF